MAPKTIFYIFFIVKAFDASITIKHKCYKVGCYFAMPVLFTDVVSSQIALVFYDLYYEVLFIINIG